MGEYPMPDLDRKQFLKVELLNLGYPWPDHLEGKSKAWLEAEIRTIRPVDASAKTDVPSRSA
jgi:hypothetical protein